MFRKLLSFFGLTQKRQEIASDQEAPEEFRKAKVEDRLNQLMQSRLAGSSSAVGQLMILNLEAAKRRIGAKWPLVSRHVHLLVENILSQRLGRSNIFFRCEEGLYAIVFSDRTREEAEAKCQALSIEIMNRLFGEIPPSDTDEAATGLELAVHGQANDLDLSKLPASKSLTEGIQALVVENRRIFTETANIPSSFHSVIERSEEKFVKLVPEIRRTKSPILLKRMKTLVQQLREFERGLVASQPITPAATRHDRAKGDASLHAETTGKIESGWTQIKRMPDPFTRLSQLIEKAEAEITELEREVGVPVPPPVVAPKIEQLAVPIAKPLAVTIQDEIEWQAVEGHDIQYAVDYLPLVDTETGIKAIVVGRIRYLLNNRIYEPEGLVREEEDIEIRLIADRLLLRSVMNEIKSVDTSHCITLIPLDQGTLENITARRNYLQMVSQLTEESRRMVILEVQLKSGWQPAAVALWLQDLQPYCRAIFLRLPLDAMPEATLMRRLGSWSVRQTSTIGIAFPFGTTLSLQSRADIEMLAKLGESMTMRNYVLGLNRFQDIDFCINKGIRYITFERYMPPRKMPGPIKKIDLTKVLDLAKAQDSGQPQR